MPVNALANALVYAPVPGRLRTLRMALATLLALFVLAFPVAHPRLALAQSVPGGVLVAGAPPLTRSTVDSVANFLEWVLEAPLSAAQRREIEDGLVADWRRADAGAMETVADIVAVQGQLAGVGDAERLTLRRELQSLLLESAREDPSDPVAAVVLAAYDAARRPLAPGRPPLTRQVTDAFAETIVFALQVVATGDTWTVERELDEAFKGAIAQGLASGYGAMAAPEQQALAQLPLLRAALREAWPGLPVAERGALREGFRPTVQELLGTLDCEAFAALAEAGLVEQTAPHAARLRSCRGEPAASPAQPQPQPAPSAPARQASQPAPSGSSQQGTNPVAQQAQQNQAFRQAQQGLMSSHNTYIHMSNVLTQNHAANMNAILTMGGSPYRYTVKYR